MCSNRLQLITPIRLRSCGTHPCTRKLSRRPSSPLLVADALVQPVDAVRDLGVYTDSDLGA